MISDGGSHFKNDLMRELTSLLGIEHHITSAYCPWANDSVEIVGKDLIFCCRSLCSEFRDEWDLVLPMIEVVTNHRYRVVLGGRSAIEVMTGRKPVSPVTLAVWSGVKMKTAKKFVGKSELVERHCAKLELSLHRLHEAVRDLEEDRLRRKAIREARV